MLPIRLLPSPTLRRKRLQPLITEVFRRHDLLPSWGLAFACVESNFRPWATNHAAGDGRRGGAWGLFQMTHKTALGLGFPQDADPKELLDPQLNATYAAELVRQLSARWHNLRDVAAAYNSGKPYALAPPATAEHDARGYAQKVVAWQATYAQRGVDAA